MLERRGEEQAKLLSKSSLGHHREGTMFPKLEKIGTGINLTLDSTIPNLTFSQPKQESEVPVSQTPNLELPRLKIANPPKMRRRPKYTLTSLEQAPEEEILQ